MADILEVGLRWMRTPRRRRDSLGWTVEGPDSGAKVGRRRALVERRLGRRPPVIVVIISVPTKTIFKYFLIIIKVFLGYEMLT